MERGRAPYADGMSRFLSTLAILIALGCSYFLYQENQALKTELASIQASAMTHEAATEFNRKWDEQLTTSLNKWKDDANAALKLDDTARETRNKLVEDAVANLQSYRTELIALARERVEQIKPPEAPPRLSLAENRMRPDGDDVGTNYVVIANDGDANAEIQSVVFRPRLNGQFEVTEDMRKNARRDGIVIQFSPRDNTAEKVGRHGDYEKVVFGMSISSKRSANLSVEIRNSKYIDWGWEGELEVDYNGSEPLVIPNIRAIFVEGESAST